MAVQGRFAPWSVALLGLGFLGAAGGLLSAGSSGTLHRAGLELLMACALAMAAVASSRGAPRPATSAMGGAGYAVPSSRRVRALHVALTLLYNLGVMVIVLAALVRARLVPLTFNQAVLDGFPFALALYLLLLTLAAKWRIDEQGGVVRAWYTRVHGVFLAVMGAAVLAIGAILLTVSKVEGGGLDLLVGADLEVLVLVGLLGVGTQLFLAANLPTIFDLGSGAIRAIRNRGRDDGSKLGTPPIVYAGVLALVITATLVFVGSNFNVAGVVGTFADSRLAALILGFPLFLLVFFAISAYQIRSEARRGLYKRKVTPEARAAILTYGVAALLGTLFGTLLLLNVLGRITTLGPFEGGTTLSKDLLLLGILGTAGPVGVHLRRVNPRVDAIEERLPDFLNDLAETRRAGLTLAAALQACSLSDYGALSKEIRKMADQVAWGVAFNDVLTLFAQRVKTSLVQRTTFLIIEASRTGGSVAEILKAAAREAYEIKGLEAERKTTMTTYLIVIYVVFAVFLAVIAVLAVQFIPQVIAANQAVLAAKGAQGSGGGFDLGGSPLDQRAIGFSYFMAAMIQSVGNGLVGGVLSEGRVSAGLRHVAIMALLSWVVFRVLIP
jgi:flagellar protein FlaJ